MTALLREIDLHIFELLQQRWEFVSQQKGNVVFNPCLEPQMDNDLLARIAESSLPAGFIKSIFREIDFACRAINQPLKVAYLGPQGTFAYEASLKQFGHLAEYFPTKGIAEVFDEVEKGRTNFGVVPIENSSEGTVNITLDRFVPSSTRICGEIFLEIHHYLLSQEGNKDLIRKIYSHPQAIAQCRNWLALNLPEASLLEISSTAKAAELALNDPNCAAIASETTAQIYNLKIVASSIEDNLSNYTRFLAISREDAPRCGQDKTSLLVFIKDRVGALFEMLGPFAKHRINLTKIESRPSKKKPWEYIFFIDIHGHREDANVQAALKEIDEQSQWLKILGSYPRGELPE